MALSGAHILARNVSMVDRRRKPMITMLVLGLLSVIWTSNAEAEDETPYGRIIAMKSKDGKVNYGFVHSEQSTDKTEANSEPPYTLERGQTAPEEEQDDTGIFYLTPVYADDEVTITSEDLKLVVRLCNGEEVDWSTGPLEPDKTKRNLKCSPNLFSNALAYLGRGIETWFSALPPGDDDGNIVPMVTRGRPGGDLEVPLLDSSTPYRVIAGNRQFALEWNGGVSPFTVWILPAGSDNSIVPGGTAIEGQTFGLATLDLPIGRYDLIIEDANGDRVVSVLDVVASDEMPTVPPGLNDVADADRNLAQLAYLAWLTTEDRSWTLEAYLQARLLAKSFPPADILADRLADGRILPVSLD